MALASDLMGLGVSPLLAQRTATGGNGPLTITAVGATFASATRIQASQFLVSNTTTGGLSIALPAIGGDNGAFLADDFIINNRAAASLNVFASTGVAISANGTNNSQIVLSSHQTLTVYPITTTQWIGVLGN
jgi:hypothetical protein